MLQRNEYLLLGDFAYNSSDEHVRMRMREYFTVYWHEDQKKDWADFGVASLNARRYPKRKRMTRQDIKSVARGDLTEEQ